ncbi:malonyl-CoA decarboxylase domain-containing protein [Paracoccus sp. JM45]|uniref:malonyl-CoA decarboxylase domain-containing protein n=1 Tax=Paracoccus sp. JM45 TaxID=2283626 RepID=UPI000E6D4B8A|nr:malonyl-CoA decarboxylase family protein [Paracoccus sp. JM45]RJE79620.1 MCD, Malonyl-CoA decarboxylase MCD [Paracoccus sp. JM45]
MVKQRLTFLTDFVEAVTRRTRGAGSEAETLKALALPALERINAACSVLMGRIGDAARVAVAEQALTAYSQLQPDEKRYFFQSLRDDYGVDAGKIRQAYATWHKNPDAGAVANLFCAVEPARQTLLRRLNLAPGATSQLVAMRQDLLQAIRNDPTLAPIDQDFSHLLTSWFNRGFLSMRRIDWNTSAAILEQIMRFESVHKMQGWDDLKRRLSPDDRRLYAFFHPATGDVPLIFVEVALTLGMPDAIAPILTAPESDTHVEADTAVFYSINNSLAGLKGVSFGNFLIKQVVAELSRDLPNLKSFVTLSPAPGFARWLAYQNDDRAAALSAALSANDWQDAPERIKALRPEVEALAARYIVTERQDSGLPPDPVARFHLGNGASAHRLNWPADMAPSAQKAAHGLMINYLYELTQIETRHEAFVRDGHVAHGLQLANALAR